MPFPLRALSIPPALSLRTHSHSLPPLCRAFAAVAAPPRHSSHPFLTLSLSLSLLSFEPNTTSSAGPVYACLSSLSFFLLSTSVTAVPFSPPRYPSLIFLPPLRSYHLAAPTFLTSSSSLSIHLPIRLSIYIYTYNIYISFSLHRQIAYVLCTGIAARNCPSRSDVVCSLSVRRYQRGLRLPTPSYDLFPLLSPVLRSRCCSFLPTSHSSCHLSSPPRCYRGEGK